MGRRQAYILFSGKFDSYPEYQMKQPKRTIRINGTGQELKLSKATAVKTKNNMIHLDELPDGTWRLIYNGNMIPDFSKIESFEVVRD